MFRPGVRLALAGVVLSTLSASAFALTETRHWVGVGPEGGSVLSLAIEPGSPSVVFAGGNGGVFLSADAGSNWKPVGLERYKIFALAFDPSQPRSLYAGTNSGLFKS